MSTLASLDYHHEFKFPKASISNNSLTHTCQYMSDTFAPIIYTYSTDNELGKVQLRTKILSDGNECNQNYTTYKQLLFVTHGDEICHRHFTEFLTKFLSWLILSLNLVSLLYRNSLIK